MGVKDRLQAVSEPEKSVYEKYRLQARALLNLAHPSGRYLFPL